MESRYYLLMAAIIIAEISMLRIRLMYMIKGKKIKGRVEGYVTRQGYFFPLINFEYNDETLTLETKSGLNKKKYAPGTQLNIRYIPKHHKCVKLVNDYTDLFHMMFLLVILAVVMVAIKFR